jgi:hypothetical protein
MAKLPTISSKIPPDLRQFLERVREALEASGKDELVTAESLVASGLASWNGFTFSPIAPRYAAPTAPTNLETEGALTNVMLTWDKAPYEGHAYTEIWAAEQDPLKKAPPTLGDAQLVGMAPGRFYAHEIGSGGKRYYWIRFVNINNDVGPYNATDGTVGETAPDPSYLLELLTGEITESQLYEDLGTKIGQISQNAADIVSTQSIVNGLAEQVTTLITSDGSNYSAVQTLAQSVDGVLGQYSVKIDTSGHVSGYGLISENINGDVQSAFGIRADTFWIAPEAYNSNTAPTNNLYEGFVWNDTSTSPAVTKYYDGTNWVEEPPNLPFVVRTTPTTINGETVDPGVYMESAYIANGTITNAKIGNAAIDDAKIANLDAGKITTGYLDAGRIEAESITADKIDTRGLSIKDQNGNVIFAAGTPIATANISGLGSFATLDQITADNISTYIESAAISSAVIGDYIKSSLYDGVNNIASANANTGTQGWILDVASDRAVFNGNSVFKGVLDVKSNTSGARLEIKNDTIKVYDESGNLRVLIGSLV